MTPDLTDLRTEIRNLHRKASPEQKAKIKELKGKAALDDIEDVELLTEMLNVLQ